MEQFLALKASAGSGKTFALSVRYIALLLLDINPSSILTLTFTNKAALEMSERIFKTLINLGNDKIILDAIIEQTDFTKEIILEKKQTILNRFLSSELAILTLDKFMNKILREFSGYLGLGEDFTIQNSDHDYLLYKFLLTLDEEHFDALISFSHNFESKLSTIITLFTILDEKNEAYEYYDFSSAILKDFEDKALGLANSIKQHIENLALSPSAIKGVAFSTLEELMKKTWLEKDCLEEYHYFKKAKKELSPLHDTFVALKKTLGYYINYKELGDLNTLFKIYNYYRDFRLLYKKEKNQLKFSDVTNLVYELLDRYVDKDFLYFRLDSRYDHIMIDEFQDTSVLQFKILKPLIDEILSGNNERYKTFFYVGDTKQSIYRFRGGKKELFDYVLHHYGDDLKIDYLNTNYRSAKNVVAFTNQIFLEQSNYPYHTQEVDSEIEGCVEVIGLSDEDEPYNDVKLQVQRMIQEGINPNNIAILTYTNEDVLRVYNYLKENFPTLKITTDMTSRLVAQKNVKALINSVRYLYFKEDIYLSNFNAILNREMKKDFDLSFDLDKKSLQSIVYEIGQFFGLLDENVIKFIEVIDCYKDIVTFVYEVDTLDSSMISKENSGLQILTIFKSKGLEFDTVILLDRIKNKNSDKGKLLFSYDAIELKKIFFKNKERILFDSFYNEAITNEALLSRDDELNIIYVAITRAKYNLIVLVKKEKSVFETLDKKITDTKIGSLYIAQTINYEEKRLEKVSYEPLFFGVQELQIEKTILEESENLKARYFGIATHYCLEMMEYFDTTSLEQAFAQTKAKFHQWLKDEAFEDLYMRINCLISNNQFVNIITQCNYTKEQELLYNGELKIIDLLAEDEKSFYIFDYKTTTATSDSHIEQVRYYKKAIGDITNKDTKGYLIYLKNDESILQEV